MLRSDRERIEASLRRHESRWERGDHGDGTPEAMLSAAVDWLRAAAKIARRMCAAEGTTEDVDAWVDERFFSAAILVYSEACKLTAEIRSDLDK